MAFYMAGKEVTGLNPCNSGRTPMETATPPPPLHSRGMGITNAHVRQVICSENLEYFISGSFFGDNFRIPYILNGARPYIIDY